MFSQIPDKKIVKIFDPEVWNVNIIPKYFYEYDSIGTGSSMMKVFDIFDTPQLIYDSDHILKFESKSGIDINFQLSFQDKIMFSGFFMKDHSWKEGLVLSQEGDISLKYCGMYQKIDFPSIRTRVARFEDDFQHISTILSSNMGFGKVHVEHYDIERMDKVINMIDIGSDQDINLKDSNALQCIDSVVYATLGRKTFMIDLRYNQIVQTYKCPDEAEWWTTCNMLGYGCTGFYGIGKNIYRIDDITMDFQRYEYDSCIKIPSSFICPSVSVYNSFRMNGLAIKQNGLKDSYGKILKKGQLAIIDRDSNDLKSFYEDPSILSYDIIPGLLDGIIVGIDDGIIVDEKKRFGMFIFDYKNGYELDENF